MSNSRRPLRASIASLAIARPSRLTRALSLMGAALMLAGTAQGQTAGELQQIERLQREEQERQQRQFEQDRSRARPPASLQPATPARPAERPAGPCHTVNEITLGGVTLFSEADRDAMVKPYLGRCLNVNDLERLMGDITLRYVNAGYIAARVYLGRQTLASGQLELTVVEGRLTALRIDDGDSRSISAFNAFPALLDRPLDLRRIEQGLDQINRLASNSATMAIEPGAKPGDSILVVRNTPIRPWRIGASADTLGSKATGRYQAGVMLSYDNPLGFDDFITGSYRRAVDTDGGRRGSEATSLGYNIPFGWLLVSAGSSYSTFNSTVALPSGAEASSNGKSRNDYLRADQVVYRNRDSLYTLSGSLTRKDSKAYFEGQLLQVSSRVLAVADIDLSVRTQAGGGLLLLGIGVSQGLSQLGALKDAGDLPGSAPKAQFSKQRLSATWMRQFPLASSSLDVSTQFNAQFARDALYGSEQISVGGPYSVRGFQDASIANDKGWTWRNELGWTRPLQLAGKAASVRAYVGLDAGEVRSAHGQGQQGRLAGAAIGVQTKFSGAVLDVFAMRPLKRHADFPDAGGSVQATLSFTY